MDDSKIPPCPLERSEPVGRQFDPLMSRPDFQRDPPPNKGEVGDVRARPIRNAGTRSPRFALHGEEASAGALLCQVDAVPAAPRIIHSALADRRANEPEGHERDPRGSRKGRACVLRDVLYCNMKVRPPPGRVSAAKQARLSYYGDQIRRSHDQRTSRASDTERLGR